METTVNNAVFDTPDKSGSVNIAIGNIRKLTRTTRYRQDEVIAENNFNHVSAIIYQAALRGENSVMFNRGDNGFDDMSPEVIKRLEAMHYFVNIGWPNFFERWYLKLNGRSLTPVSFEIMW